jgi:integrase
VIKYSPAGTTTISGQVAHSLNVSRGFNMAPGHLPRRWQGAVERARQKQQAAPGALAGGRQQGAPATTRRRRRRCSDLHEPLRRPLTDRAVNYTLKAAADRAGLPGGFSAHWLRHAYASHAIEHGAALPVMQSTLGHGNIAVTSGYLHARPSDSSGLHLDSGVFL